MRLKVFIGTTLSALIATLALPTWAQGDPPADGAAPPRGGAPTEEPAAPPSGAPAPTDEAPKVVPPPAEPSTVGPAANGAATSPRAAPDFVATDDEMADTGTTKIGATLSPLVITAAAGYAYASVNHPDVVSHSLSGPFVEVTAGTELDRRFRLSLAFTNFETKIRRTANGKWEEGDYQPRSASSGLHTAADPIEPIGSSQGGVEVQKIFHANSIGPRMDFLPMGSQGPYIGMTAAVAIIQDVSTRVGADLAARVGAEWRPFHSLGLAVEAGAHGQIYDDSKAAIPYAMGRLSLMLEPPGMQKKGTTPSAPPSTWISPRTLPPPGPR